MSNKSSKQIIINHWKISKCRWVMDDEIMNKIQVILTTTDAKIKGGKCALKN